MARRQWPGFRSGRPQGLRQGDRLEGVTGPDPGVLRALQTALDADPSNVGIRLHLAGLLTDSDPHQALEHLVIVLAAQPDHREALALAARTARLGGDSDRAAAWQRLHDALEPPSDAAADAAAVVSGDVAQPKDPGPGAEAATEVDWDAELLALIGRESGQRVSLADVAGLTGVKERLQVSFLGPLRNPQMRRTYGASLRGGLLLWGPPGCGKTFLARAVAGELGAHFISVGLHDVLDMWLGSSEKRLHQLFELARRRQPSVLFFDEVDAIGHARTDLNRSASRNVVAQLLAELDGVDTSNEGVFVIGATNQPWDVDPALRRPGRLDRTMLVLPPDPQARAAILQLHLRDRPASVESLSLVVEATDGFSGADLKLVCDDAAQYAMADAVRSGTVRPISANDLLASTHRIRPSTQAWFDMARNFATYANTSGEYDELVTHLQSQPKRRR